MAVVKTRKTMFQGEEYIEKVHFSNADNRFRMDLPDVVSKTLRKGSVYGSSVDEVDKEYRQALKSFEDAVFMDEEVIFVTIRDSRDWSSKYKESEAEVQIDLEELCRRTIGKDSFILDKNKERKRCLSSDNVIAFTPDRWNFFKRLFDEIKNKEMAIRELVKTLEEGEESEIDAAIEKTKENLGWISPKEVGGKVGE